MSKHSSYARILKSSSIMGGAAGINMLISMVRTKFAAVLIGTGGVGLLTSFTAVQGLIGTVAGLGIQTSAVREVALAVGKGDDQAIGRAVMTLRRVCWLTGMAGMFAMMALSPMISQLTFGSDEYLYDIAALGIVILLANISGGQMALIQGMRRIGDLARINVLSAALGTIVAVSLYAWLGLRGIVPSLLAIALITLFVSWRFARRVPVPEVNLSWKRTWPEAGGMVRLGLVFMWNGLLASAVSYLTVMLITRELSLEAVGLYSAAFALSGVLVNFVLQAMGADYYPRLMAVAEDKVAVNRLVNEQTEVGLLLAMPGLLATMALAPWVIQIFYTSAFLPAVELLHWFILGCLGRVISWPLGYVMLALGKGQWLLLTETGFNALHALMIAVGLQVFGLKGVAMAFFLLYVMHVLAMLIVAHRLTSFAWIPSNLRLIVLSMSALFAMLLLTNYVSIWPATIIGLAVATFVSAFNIRSLLDRVGSQHPLVKMASRIPLFKTIFGL